MTGLRTAVCLLRAMVYPELSLRHHCLTTSSRVVYVSLEDSPTTWRLIGSTLPSCGSAASRFSVEGRAPCYRVRETSLRLRSTSECDPGYPHLKWCTLSRGFLPLQRNPTDSSHRPRAFHCPGHVASFCLPCNSTLCSRIDLPGVSQPGAFMGFSALQSLT